ncbi:hypothetical protein L0222_12360 [bacterium]|nr:hypothetical protein [bacterium]MCI0605886.1 hypothetical protein [bacterium]
MRKFCFLTVLLVASTLFAAYPDEYPAYLRLLGFSKGDIRDLQYGRFIMRSLKDGRPGESGVTAAKVFHVPGYFIRDYFSYIENFRNLNNFQAVGKFKPEPDLQDLGPLTFDALDLQDLAGCKQSCTLNLTSEEIAGIQQDSNLENLYRKILLNRVQNYRKGGDPSNSYLEAFAHLTAYFPDVVEYAAIYPAGRDRRVPDYFYWEKQKIGKKSVIQLRHVFSQRVGEDFVVVNHLIYSNHSLMASASVFHLINYVDYGFPRTLLVYHGRTQVDGETRAPRVDKKMFVAFRKAGKKIEERYSTQFYPGFPYALPATDQR